VLNGRLVGVEPAAGIDPDVLGGVLNSTFVTLMRLIEGVATGNEGAFDVGPPAARVMRVPDPRMISPGGHADILHVMDEVRSAGVIPSAPSAQGHVPELRKRLDLAVAVGLGLSRGDAAVLVDRLYLSYARWRSAVEAVEDQMQGHRRALARRGGARQENPALRAGRTVWDEMSPVVPPLLADLAAGGVELLDPVVPQGHGAQDALFENTVVLDGQRRPLDLGDGRRVELAAYLRGLGITGAFPLPVNPAQCVRILEEAKDADAAFVAEAARRARAHVSDDLVDEVVSHVRHAWLAQSIAGIREATPKTDSAEPDPSLFHPEGMVPPSPNR
jgi:hypothetical protein